MRTLDGKSLLRICGATFAVAWVLRLAMAFAMGRFHDLTRMDMERIALSLAKTGVMGNPFHTPTGPSALVPPGYVLALAAIFHWFGTGVAAEAVKIITCTAASSLRCALTPWLAARLNLGPTSVVASALLSILWIGAFDTELQGDWDTPYTTILLIVLTWLHYSRPVLSSPPRWAAQLGLVWGLVALINPTVLSTLGGFLVVEAWRGGRGRLMKSGSQAICLGACLVLMLVPWAARNRLALGNWVWLRSGLGIEMYLSYHPGASWANPRNIRPSLAHPDQPNRDAEISPHPYINPSESRQIERIGEVAYSRQKMGEALDWIRQNPSESLRLAAQHAFYFWLPPGPGFYSFRPGRIMVVYSAARWALTVLAFAGWRLLWRSHRRAAVHFGSLLVFFPLVYYVVNWSSRYRIPIEWVLVLLAAVAVSRAWEGVRRGGHSEIS